MYFRYGNFIPSKSISIRAYFGNLNYFISFWFILFLEQQSLRTMKISSIKSLREKDLVFSHILGPILELIS